MTVTKMVSRVTKMIVMYVSNPPANSEAIGSALSELSATITDEYTLKYTLNDPECETKLTKAFLNCILCLRVRNYVPLFYSTQNVMH